MKSADFATNALETGHPIFATVQRLKNIRNKIIEMENLTVGTRYLHLK